MFASDSSRFQRFRTDSFLLCTIAAMSFAVPMTSQAATLTYDASLSGPAESPPNASPGTGFAIVTIDTILDTMEVNVSFSGLVAPNTASHIHCCTPVADSGTAGVATTTPTFTGFPSGVTSGTYDNTFDMTLLSSYNPAFVAANGGTAATAFAVLLAGLNADEAYLNIHSTTFPGGEIRGFLAATPIPAALPLFAGGLGLMGFLARRRKRNAVA
jgi:CHRD domain